MNNVDEMLQHLLNESDKQLPYRPNTVRRDLDFEVVPHMVYSDPTIFVRNCINYKTEYLCDLFNHYYSMYNPIYYSDDPRTFKAEDFGIIIKRIDNEKRILVISLPEEFMGSREYCTAYVLAYHVVHNTVTDIKFYTLEDTSYGWKNIGYISSSLEHQHLAHPTGYLNNDINIIINDAFPQ